MDVEEMCFALYPDLVLSLTLFFIICNIYRILFLTSTHILLTVHKIIFVVTKDTKIKITVYDFFRC
jgi:hypothetical protein